MLLSHSNACAAPAILAAPTSGMRLLCSCRAFPSSSWSSFIIHCHAARRQRDDIQGPRTSLSKTHRTNSVVGSPAACGMRCSWRGRCMEKQRLSFIVRRCHRGYADKCLLLPHMSFLPQVR